MYLYDSLELVFDGDLCLVQGKWTASSTWNSIVDPLNGYPFINVAEVQEAEIKV